MFFLYCRILLNYAIGVVPTDICGTTPKFLGMTKGVTGLVVSYHPLLIAPPRSPLSPKHHSDLMDSYFSLI